MRCLISKIACTALIVAFAATVPAQNAAAHRQAMAQAHSLLKANRRMNESPYNFLVRFKPGTAKATRESAVKPVRGTRLKSYRIVDGL